VYIQQRPNTVTAVEHHVHEHLHLVAVVAQSCDDADEELMQIYSGETGVEKGVHRLVRGLACVQPLVDLVRSGTHLNGLDELRLHNRLFEEPRQKHGQVIPDKLRLLRAAEFRANMASRRTVKS